MSYREFLNKLLIGESSGGVSSWNDLTDKPTTFPPSAHTHAQADVTGLPDIAAKAHAHANKATLDKFGESGGKPTYDGAEIGGGSDVDESRLLPALDSVPTGRSGNPLVFKAVPEGTDEHTLLYMPCEDYADHSSYNRTITLDTNNSISIDTTDKKFGAASLLGNGSNRAGVIAELPVAPFATDTTVHAWVKIKDANDRCGIFDTYGAADGNSGEQSKGVGGIALWTYQGKLKAYKASAHFSSYWYDDDDSNLLVEANLPSDYLNRWMHVALVRSNLTWILLVDGVKLAENIKDFTPDKKFIRLAQHYNDAMTGNLDEFIVLDYAKWISDFTPPAAPATTLVKSYEISDLPSGTVKSVNNQLPDEAGNVTVETGSTVDESRLLPESAVDGDIPCFDATATTGGGNDSTTKLLLQPATSNNQIVDQAAGNAAPVTLQNTGVTVDDAGAMVFDGNSYLTLAANVLPSDFLNGTDDWTLDLIYNVSSKSIQCLFGRGDSPRLDFLLHSSGALEIGGGPSFGSGWPFDTDVRLTFELYKDGSSWKYTAFRDGSVVTSGTWTTANWRSVILCIGWDGNTDSRKINGKIKALRLTAGATHRGVAFTPDELPWAEPQVVGEWGKFNKATLALKSDILPAWYTVADAAAITLNRANGELQKVTLTQNCVLTAPTLDADNPTLLLQITSSTAVTVKVGETEVISGKTGTFQIGWFWDGSAARRYPVVEVV